MKKLIAKLLVGALALISARCAASDVVAYTTPPMNMATGAVAVAASTTVSNLCGTNFMAIRPGSGISVFPYFSGANSATCTGALTFTFQVCYDKTHTNWSNLTNGLTTTFNLNGSNVMRGYYHFSAASLNDAQGFRLGSYVNADTNAAGITVSNVVASHFFAP